KRRGHVREELVRDLVTADSLDRLRQLELAPVDPDPLRLPDPVGDVRRSHRAEEGAGLAGLDVEPELCAFQLLHQLLGLLEALGLVPRTAGCELLELGHPAGCGGLGEPPRQQVVAREARGDVDELAAEPDLLDVLSEDDLHRRLTLPVAVAPVATVAAAVRALLAALRDVRQQRHLACPLHRHGDLPLVAPAGTGDPARADLPLLGDVAPELVRVLPVDVHDLVSAEPTVLLPDRAGCRPAAPALLLTVLLLRH